MVQDAELSRQFCPIAGAPASNRQWIAYSRKDSESDARAGSEKCDIHAGRWRLPPTYSGQACNLSRRRLKIVWNKSLFGRHLRTFAPVSWQMNRFDRTTQIRENIADDGDFLIINFRFVFADRHCVGAGLGLDVSVHAVAQNWRSTRFGNFSVVCGTSALEWRTTMRSGCIASGQTVISQRSLLRNRWPEAWWHRRTFGSRTKRGAYASGTQKGHDSFASARIGTFFFISLVYLAEIFGSV